MASFYNDIDPYAAQWLRNLIKSGLIPDGEVSTQSIVDLRPSDLSGFDQCHFFAGIGGWSQALHLAGWAPDRPVWTGSCPCQPFSVAGKGAGTDDPRHLWPHFHRLIAACRPPVVMGEQVAGKAGYGWFDGVRADLEGSGYSGRAADIPALAVNAPHIRQRLYWVAVDLADAGHMRGRNWTQPDEQELSASSRFSPAIVAVDDTASAGLEGHSQLRSVAEGGFRKTGIIVGSKGCSSIYMAHADEGGRGRRPRDGDGERDGQAGGRHEGDGFAAGGGEDRDTLANTSDDSPWPGLQQAEQAGGWSADDRRHSPRGGGFWSDHVWLAGSDGKARRAKPGLPLLAYGIPNRVGRLRAYGNAIIPPLAAEVVKALMETLDV